MIFSCEKVINIVSYHFIKHLYHKTTIFIDNWENDKIAQLNKTMMTFLKTVKLREFTA